MIRWLNDWMIEWLGDWMIEWLGDWMIDWLLYGCYKLKHVKLTLVLNIVQYVCSTYNEWLN